MPHTVSKFEQDTPFTDGFVVAGLEDIIAFAATDGVKTRNAAGDFSFNQAASKNVNYVLNIGQLLQRSGLAPDIMNQFGGTGIPGEASPGGRPPFTGTTALKPRTTNKPKGIQILGFRVAHRIDTVNMTALTIRADKVTYKNGVAAAPQIDAVIAPSAISPNFSANMYVSTIMMPAPVWFNTDFQELVVEINAQTPVGGAYRLYRVEVLVAYNYN